MKIPRERMGSEGLGTIAVKPVNKEITSELFSSDDLLEVATNESSHPAARFSLRLSSQLLRGLVRLYQRKVTVLLGDLCMINATVLENTNKKWILHDAPIYTENVQRPRLQIILQEELENVEDEEDEEDEENVEELLRATNTSCMPYNFMISSDGETFEALGWRIRSPLFPQYSADALVLVFIDNYTQEAPKQAQILKAKNFFAEALSQERLQPRFVVIGKTVNEFSKYLFKYL